MVSGDRPISSRLPVESRVTDGTSFPVKLLVLSSLQLDPGDDFSMRQRVSRSLMFVTPTTAGMIGTLRVLARLLWLAFARLHVIA